MSNISFSVNDPNNADISFLEEQITGGLLHILCKIRFRKKVSPEKITLSFSQLYPQAYSYWNPITYLNRSVRPGWARSCSASRLASGAPVACLIDARDHNALTVALSDAAVPHQITMGLIEETGKTEVRAELFAQPIAPISEYTVTLRIDTRDIPFYEAIPSVEAWWNDFCGYRPAPVPDVAKLPMDSLWYSFHQALDTEKILAECRESKKLGMDTVIIDDGWQTDDNNRGYAFCGDWELATKKIPDMAALSDSLHEMGMKVMLWFSVPFVGAFSKNYERFLGMYLKENGRKNVFCLDPRFKEVRDFLTEVYANAVKSYHLDGVKLDFIDSFRLSAADMEEDPRRDKYSLEDGVSALLEQVTKALRAIDPNILIEFRQTYIGPCIRQYGNILRVGDCPADPLRNRGGVFDLRLLSGSTAVHSDMLMWTAEEKPEHAALQLLAVLFSVPQISVYLPHMPSDHKKMLGHYLAIWKKYRNTLLNGRLRVYDPEANYTLASADNGRELLAVRYAAVPFVIDAAYEEILLFNAKNERASLVESAVDLEGKECHVYDCLGNELACLTLDSSPLFSLPIPTGGMAIIR